MGKPSDKTKIHVETQHLISISHNYNSHDALGGVIKNIATDSAGYVFSRLHFSTNGMMLN